MFRRGISASASRQASASISAAVQTSAARSYFSAGAGEVGITGATMARFYKGLFFFCFCGCPLFMYKVAIKPWTPDQQFVYMTTDKWYSDGTELKGEEATANLRLQRERIMPIMDAYLEKIEKSAQTA